MRTLLALFFGALSLILIPSAAQSGVVEIRPTLLTITPSQHIAILSLVNPDARPTVYQVRIFRWRQNDKEQTLDPTDDVIASPPMVSLGDHGSQIVRIGLRGPLPASEAAYRLILEEVPSSNVLERQGLTIALRLSLPLFVRPQEDLPPDQLSASLHQSGNNATVKLYNKGPFTSRVVQLALAPPGIDKEQRPLIKQLAYIMPGKAYSFDFSLPDSVALPRDTKVSVQTDQGPVDLSFQTAPEAISDASPPQVH